MTSSARQTLAIVLVAVVMLSTIGAGAALLAASFSDGYKAENVTYATNSGVNVTLQGQYNVSSGNPFTDDQTLDLKTNKGNVTVSGSGPADITLTQLTGTETRAEALDVTTNGVTINPEDKQQVTIKGATDNISIRAMELDDGTQDFTYAGASGTTTLTVTGLRADITIVAVDQSGTQLDKAVSDANGVVTFEMPNSEHTVSLQSSTNSKPDLANADPTGAQSETPTELRVDVSDSDFPNDEVQVNISLDGTLQSSQNITQDQEVNTTIGSLSPGSHNWTVEATDSYGNVRTESYTFALPDDLVIYNESNSTALVDDREVTATFFHDGDRVFERTTTNGTVPLDGLPATTDIVAVVEASSYYQRTVVIEDITEQNRAYLLNTSASAVEVRFKIDDATGTFGSESTLQIKRPLNVSGTLQYETMTGDTFGVEGVTTDLEQDVRYRLVLKNQDGEVRVLGSYTADVSETVTLRPSGLKANYTDGQNYGWDSAFVNESGSPAEVTFQFSDPAQETTDLVVTIHERGNKSNTLAGYPVEFDGPLGNVSISEPLTADQAQTQWVVSWEAQRNGKAISSSSTEGEFGVQLVELDSWWQQAIAFAVILITGGLFSKANVGVGSVTVALGGGIFWAIGWLGNAATGATIALALGVAVTFWSTERGGF